MLRALDVCLGAGVADHLTGFTTPVDFTAGVGILAVLAAALAAMPPATYAARLDLVAAMRTP
ncbi:hypothetical protein [Propioniciclava soli]|uniref:Uncharacterized protein n=1 Tax=Propioniciclava soli TaxID=2775081 RepID=A0ABZ3C5A0_9ACTN|nr:hypothetical protein [Propioniciclava soli]